MSKTGSNDGGPTWWVILKVVLIAVGAIVAVGFLLSIFKYLIALALVGGAGYVGYKLLSSNKDKAVLDAGADPLRLESSADSEISLELAMRELEDEDHALSEEISRLSSQ